MVTAIFAGAVAAGSFLTVFLSVVIVLILVARFKAGRSRKHRESKKPPAAVTKKSGQNLTGYAVPVGHVERVVPAVEAAPPYTLALATPPNSSPTETVFATPPSSYYATPPSSPQEAIHA